MKKHHILISRLNSFLELQLNSFLLLQLRNWKNINVIDITGHDVPHTNYLEWIIYHFILRINHKPIVPEIQYSTVRYGTVRYGTVQYSTVQYSTVQYSTVQYSTVQYSTVQYSTVQYSTVQYSTILHDQLIQTGYQEIWLVQSRSVNPHTAREIPYSPGCPAPMFAESVCRINTTNKLKQCGSRKAMQRYYWDITYLFWHDPFYHGNFKFKAKLGLGAVLLTFSHHSDSKMGHLINYLLTGCSCRTRKYKPLVFHTALASSGCMKNLGLVFPGTALAPS